MFIRRLGQHILLLVQNKFLLLWAVHTQGHLNLEADLLMRHRLRLGEWRFHSDLRSFWQGFSKADMDRFALSEMTSVGNFTLKSIIIAFATVSSSPPLLSPGI